MKIRSRLLLYLLPTLIAGVMTIAGIFSYWWKKEIDSNIQYRLTDVLMSSAKFIETNPSDLEVVLKDLPYLIKHKDFVTDITYSPLRENTTVLDHSVIHIQKLKNEKISGTIAIFNADKKQVGTITAIINAEELYQHYHQKFWIVILLTGGICILLMVFVMMIAHWISKPVQKLNQSALSIAAGKYGDTLNVQGPKEVIQLSNTLNIMSECLLENINQLKQTANIWANTYDEQDCLIHMQKKLLEEPIEESKTDIITAKSISFLSQNPVGIQIAFPHETDEMLELTLTQAKESGLSGMCHLLLKPKQKENFKLVLFKKESKIAFEATDFPEPYFWSTKKRSFLSQKNTVQLVSGDYIFLFNKAVSNFLKEKNFEPLLSRVCKFFAEDGFESLVKMLEKEIQFQLKKHSINEDLHIICVQLLY